MEALKDHQIEAALPACESAPSGCGSETGPKGQLPPGSVAHEGVQASGPGVKSPDEMRAKIMKLEAVMLQMKEHRIELPVKHHFAPGVYMRELFIPKGVTLTGKIHKTEHLNILSQGKLMVWTEDGMKTLTASTVIKSQPGIKRVGHALEDSVWITVHHNLSEERNPEKLEAMLVTTSFEDVIPFLKPKQIEGGE